VTSRIALLLAWFAAVVLFACGNDARPLRPDATVCAAPGTIGYLQVCTGDTTCDSCLCHNFGHASLCTKTCTGMADCPAPALSCQNGICQPF
jgi:hypothetical protein